MTNARHVLLKVKAWEQGRATPRQQTMIRSLVPAERTLVIAFVRMGGLSRPWAIAWGNPGSAPTIASAVDPRKTASVETALAEFAPSLLAHFLDSRPSGASTVQGVSADLLQVWLPDQSHLNMLFDLAKRFTWRRTGDYPVEMNRLGRICGWLFREGVRPGSQIVQVATTALRDAYVFPDEEARLSKLTLLLRWLPAKWEALKVNEANLPITTTALDPHLENDMLTTLLDQLAETQGNFTEALEQGITSIIEQEARSRFSAASVAWQVLKEDQRRTNAHLTSLVESSVSRLDWFRRRELERGNLPLDEVRIANFSTDKNPTTAARTFLAFEAAEVQMTTMMLHDDEDLAFDAFLEGNLARGPIENLEPYDPRAVSNNWRDAPSGPGVMTLVDPLGHLLRLRADSTVCFLKKPQLELYLEAVNPGEDGSSRLRIFVPDCNGLSLGDVVSVGEYSYPGINKRKMEQLSASNIDVRPGAWLTRDQGGPDEVSPEPELPDLDFGDDDG